LYGYTGDNRIHNESEIPENTSTLHKNTNSKKGSVPNILDYSDYSDYLMLALQILGGFNAKVLRPMKAGFNKLIAHGVTGGVRSRLSGGSFKSGFLGSAVSYSASWSGAYEAAGVKSCC
jgi:hypothetical protein